MSGEYGPGNFFYPPAHERAGVSRERVEGCMPDWIHAVIYIIIMSAIVIVTAYYTENILAVIISIMAGHTFATALIKRLPGFWGS